MASDADMTGAVVIDHQAAATGHYIGSPSIVVLDNGAYLASHDDFGPKSGKNTTSIFTSSDRGATWTKTAEITGQFWSSLFTSRGCTYLIGTSKEFGSVVIRRSTDRGQTWTAPESSSTGLIADGRFHCAPTPVIEHEGRIWRAFEDIGGPGDWPTHFRCFMLSAPADADLLISKNWTRTNIIGQDPHWLGGTFHGWLEGNAIVDRDGSIVDLLRVDAKPQGDVAAVVRVNKSGTTATFDATNDFISMPGGSVKFTVRADVANNEYWALTNGIPKGVTTSNPGIQRNTLILVKSKDLREWQIASVIWHKGDANKFGCQYVDWQFDGADIIAVARVADVDDSGGPHDFHDANFLMFYRIKGFRDRRLVDTNLGLSFEKTTTSQSRP